jgi:uncharacterized membrane protein (DUF4010 family)
MSGVELLSRLAVALGIGLLAGLERGWRLREEAEGSRAAGFRTFALSGLLGGVAGALAAVTAPVVLGFALAAYAAIFAAFHWLEAQAGNRSATSAVAGLLTFLLGALAVLGDQTAAIAGAVAMTLLLALRAPLHRWVASLRWEEIRAVLILLAMTFLLLPLLPDRPVDPWDSINPRDVWLFAILVAAISFVGYVAVRLFGERLGILMAAVAGGIASSTATTLTLARLGRQTPGSHRLIVAGILTASIVMTLRVATLATLLNPTLLPTLAGPLAALGLVLLLGAAVCLADFRRDGSAHLEISNPLDVWMALKMAGLIAVVMAATQLLRYPGGDAGILGVAAISGLVDVDALTISMARLAGHDLEAPMATRAIVMAVAVNSISKAAIAAWVGGLRIGLQVGAATAVALAAAAAALLTR